jgi:hypothetical protein
VSSPSPSPEDGNRSSFRKVVFFGIQGDGKVQKNSVNPVVLLGIPIISALEATEGVSRWGEIF